MWALCSSALLSLSCSAVKAQTDKVPSHTEPPAGVVASPQQWLAHQDWFCPPKRTSRPFAERCWRHCLGGRLGCLASITTGGTATTPAPLREHRSLASIASPAAAAAGCRAATSGCASDRPASNRHSFEPSIEPLRHAPRFPPLGLVQHLPSGQRHARFRGVRRAGVGQP